MTTSPTSPGATLDNRIRKRVANQLRADRDALVDDAGSGSAEDSTDGTRLAYAALADKTLGNYKGLMKLSDTVREDETTVSRSQPYLLRVRNPNCMVVTARPRCFEWAAIGPLGDSGFAGTGPRAAKLERASAEGEPRAEGEFSVLSLAVFRVVACSAAAAAPRDRSSCLCHLVAAPFFFRTWRSISLCWNPP